MARSALDTAKRLLNQRRFTLAIKVLDGSEKNYGDNLDFYVTYATACLYVGDYGAARSYFQRARNLSMTDVRLLLGQAVLFLRLGETDRALQYYLDVLDQDPNNSTAKRAMEFIRRRGDYTTICNWVDSGKIKRFFPPLGVNTSIIARSALLCAALCAAVLLTARLIPSGKKSWVGPRVNLTDLALSSEEKSNAVQPDLSGTVVRYFMDSRTIARTFESAMQHVEDHRDNAAQMEINRILLSNASFSIKQKANRLMTYLEVPTFDSLTDNYDYKTVQGEPQLYLDCYAAWGGRVMNAELRDNGSWYCELLVGYEGLHTVEGIVPVIFPQEPVPAVDGEKPIRILGKIDLQDDRVILRGIAIYQPLKGNKL